MELCSKEYVEAQAEWVRQNNIKAGDRVKTLVEYPHGYGSLLTPHNNVPIGMIGVVGQAGVSESDKRIERDDGILVYLLCKGPESDTHTYWATRLPFWILLKIEGEDDEGEEDKDS